MASAANGPRGQAAVPRAADAGAAGLGIRRSEGSLRELPVNRFDRAELFPTLIWVSKRSRRTVSRSGGSYFFALIENAGTFRESGDFR